MNWTKSIGLIKSKTNWLRKKILAGDILKNILSMNIYSITVLTNCRLCKLWGTMVFTLWMNVCDRFLFSCRNISYKVILFPLNSLFVNCLLTLYLYSNCLLMNLRDLDFSFLKFYDLWMWYVYFDYWLMIKIHFITIERIWKVHHGADFFEYFILENCMKISVLSEQIYLFQILCYFVMLLIVCTRAGVNYNQVKYYLLLM